MNPARHCCLSTSLRARYDVVQHIEEEALLSIVEQRRSSEYGNSPHYGIFNLLRKFECSKILSPMPKVSVIVPVYKVEKYIERCCRSLFGQTLDDVEYIFVNDCTPDASMDILQRTLEDYPERLPQVKIKNLPQNGGLPSARKEGLALATGDYVIHCDSDDWVERTMYERMYRKAEEESLDMVLCGCFQETATGDNDVIHINIPPDSSTLEQLMIGNLHGYLWSKLVKREIYSNMDAFPQENMCEDLALSICLAYHCASFGIIDEPMYHYCYNGESISKRKRGETLLVQGSQNLLFAENHLRSHGAQTKYGRQLRHLKDILILSSFNTDWHTYIKLCGPLTFSVLTNPFLSLDKKLGHITKCLGIHGISKLFGRSK